MRNVVVAAALVAASGCYESSAPGIDAGRVDGGPCAPILSYSWCSAECGGPGACGSASVSYCTDGELCTPDAVRRGGEVLVLVCGVPLPGFAREFADGAAFSARRADACLRDRRGFGSPNVVDGPTIPEEDCDVLERELGRECYWSDGTRRTRSPPPVAACPAQPFPATPFCGPACGDCLGGPSAGIDLVTPCIGRNDDRDVGVCAVVPRGLAGCSPDLPVSARCPLAKLFPDTWPTDGCACLAFAYEDATGRHFDDGGWIVPESGCRAYRALHPGAVECYDDAWAPLP